MGWDGIRTYWPPLLYVTQWHAPGDDAQLVDCKDVKWAIKLYRTIVSCQSGCFICREDHSPWRRGCRCDTFRLSVKIMNLV